MSSMEILESKLRDYISKNDRLFNDYNKLLQEVEDLKQSVIRLESEKEDIKKSIEGVITKVELYLDNTGS